MNFTKEDWKDILGATIAQRNESQVLMNKMAGSGAIRAATEYKKLYNKYDDLSKRIDKLIDTL